MSGSFTDDDGKLILCVAENGHSFAFECSETTSVESVMRFVESVSGISFSDQLLLSLDMRLEPQKMLSSFGLPASGREVFVFNKAMLQSNSHPPSPEDVDSQELDGDDDGTLHEHHPLDDASDPALKALPSYERQFRYHFLKGRAIYNCTVAKLENCERFAREQKVQERAIEVATRNMEQYYRVIYQNYLEFMRRYKHQHRLHSDLLMNFGRDVEKLRSVKIHPYLQTDSRRCLLDFVKEDNLRKAVEGCGSSHKQFENKIAQFQQMFVEVKRKVEELFACRASSLSMKDLEVTFKEHEHFINEQNSIMQSLSKDVNTVKKLVDDCMSGQFSSSLRPHDAVSALGPMYEVHDKNHLPQIQACYNSISELLEFCKNKKNEMNNFVHSYMQKITFVTYIIKDAKLQFPVFREAMLHHDELFADLRLVRGVGPAYRACLAEVVRRKASMKLYMGMAGQLAEKLAMKRETEVRQREEFLKTHGSFVPRDVLASMGLYDSPSQCDVNVSPYDTNLISIEIADVDRYAPEYLVGLQSKIAFSAEAEEIGVDSLDKDSFEDILEASEIAGTSKMEVENAKLKAELASAISRICSLGPQVEYEEMDESNIEYLLKNAAEKTEEALQAKDEYGKHLLSMLKEKQRQCDSYEKLIHELEQRLNDEYSQGERHVKASEYKAEASGPLDGNKAHVSGSEPMDEVSCVSNLSRKQPCKAREGMDENMVDSSLVLSHPLDSSMLESQQNNEKGGKDNSSTAESPPKSLGTNVARRLGLDTKHSDDIILELRNELMEKSSKLNETESKLNGAMEEVANLSRELEMNQKLLEESQVLHLFHLFLSLWNLSNASN